jgi:hypothetical protein
MSEVKILNLGFSEPVIVTDRPFTRDEILRSTYYFNKKYELNLKLSKKRGSNIFGFVIGANYIGGYKQDLTCNSTNKSYVYKITYSKGGKLSNVGDFYNKLISEYSDKGYDDFYVIFEDFSNKLIADIIAETTKVVKSFEDYVNGLGTEYKVVNGMKFEYNRTEKTISICDNNEKYVVEKENFVESENEYEFLYNYFNNEECNNSFVSNVVHYIFRDKDNKFKISGSRKYMPKRLVGLVLRDLELDSDVKVLFCSTSKLNKVTAENNIEPIVVYLDDENYSLVNSEIWDNLNSKLEEYDEHFIWLFLTKRKVGEFNNTFDLWISQLSNEISNYTNNEITLKRWFIETVVKNGNRICRYRVQYVIPSDTEYKPDGFVNSLLARFRQFFENGNGEGQSQKEYLNIPDSEKSSKNKYYKAYDKYQFDYAFLRAKNSNIEQ